MKSEQEKGQQAADEVARVVSLVMEQSFSMSQPACQQDELVLSKLEMAKKRLAPQLSVAERYKQRGHASSRHQS